MSDFFPRGVWAQTSKILDVLKYEGTLGARMEGLLVVDSKLKMSACGSGILLGNKLKL